MSVAPRTNEALWDRIVKSVRKSGKGGLPGQWSARKAQLAVHLYKKKGGLYKTRKSSKNSLRIWTREKWRTRSGNPSVVGPRATGERYLPSDVIRSIKKKQYIYSSMLKRRSLSAGKQYSRQPEKIRKKLGKFLKASKSGLGAWD